MNTTFLRTLFPVARTTRNRNSRRHRLAYTAVPSNPLFQQVISDANLQLAFDWLRNTQTKNLSRITEDNSNDRPRFTRRDNSDIWDYSRDWDQRRAAFPWVLPSRRY